MKKTGNKGGSSRDHAQRSNVHNPLNPAFKKAVDNRARQLNPNNPAYRSSRGMTKPSGKGSTK